MFQLIVAVISIALVAALAIASIFYGGEAFTKSSEKANVTALVNQAQQISGAYQLYKTDTGAAPASVADLVTGGYLSAEPTPSKIANGVWAIGTMSVGSGASAKTVPAIGLTLKETDTSTVCQEVARQAGGSVAADGAITVAANPQFVCTAGAAAGTDPATFNFKL